MKLINLQLYAPDKKCFTYENSKALEINLATSVRDSRFNRMSEN